jgi:hypothetical protein
VENVSKDLLSNSVLSVIVKVSMSEDCIKKSSVKNFLMVGLWTTSKNVW